MARPSRCAVVRQSFSTSASVARPYSSGSRVPSRLRFGPFRTKIVFDIRAPHRFLTAHAVANARRAESVYRERPRKGKAVPFREDARASPAYFAGTLSEGRGSAAGVPSWQRTETPRETLLFAQCVDFLFQLVVPDSSDHELIADHVARCAVDAERVGKLQILGNRGFDFVAVHVLHETPHVEADLLGNSE